MQVIVKVKKIGGSMMARIPSEAVKELNLKENETVQLEVKKPKKSYFGALKGQIGEFTEADRLDSRL
ncbi:MAG: hypothetical protein HY544_02450 [Candidatus Diapherotrites archaeon]|uniref:AbrB/MazE/SpoVT family DNA-binding domain-containing protein n=1 Tax=Candidatus Iainarchaeum sp. TaxID=3101447 RepID=A0A8T3YIH9_9ARCH|nr:hypothetical protein [Candidatus Diapherotrites archaeon]